MTAEQLIDAYLTEVESPKITRLAAKFGGNHIGRSGKGQRYSFEKTSQAKKFLASLPPGATGKVTPRSGVMFAAVDVETDW